MPVRTIELKDTLLDLCQVRKDLWAHRFMAQIVNVRYLHAPDVVYHKNSDANFHTNKKIPTAHSNDKLGSNKLKLGGLQELD